jgi:hypothetical protein
MSTQTVMITLEEFLGHGGYRPGAGRKGKYGKRQKPVTMFLNQEHFYFLTAYPGADNVSDAVRMLVESYASTGITPRRVRLLGEAERVHTSITVPAYMREYLEKLGKGSFVSGVRLLIEMELLKQNR